MTKEQATREALRMALDALEYPLNISHEGFNVDMAELLAHRAITAIKEALANHIEDNLTMVAQQSNEQVEPDYKLMPREATREMLEAMDECSMEGYDERLYAGHAASVYMAAWDAFHGQHCYCGDITTLGVIHRNDGPCHYPEHTTEYKRGYADAMNWKVQNHLEHLPTAQPEHEWVRGECVKCGQSIEQPEQEPVVWMYQDKSTHEVRFQKHMRDFVDHGQTYETPLYTTPPQRKPLTDEEIILIVADCASSHQHTDIHFARAIERAHGIKELV